MTVTDAACAIRYHGFCDGIDCRRSAVKRKTSVEVVELAATQKVNGIRVLRIGVRSPWVKLYTCGF